ncbi:MAG: 3-hydroxyacyl-CoA dehydrogenase family protein [Syntrophaceae bacterium]|nr:3-hydroxyacyl-CoA dehydrogenase family protein [Syntrophaceae bacterium]
MRTISVLGLGIMGHGIAQVAAQSGFLVSVYDINEEAIQKGLDSIRSGLDRQIKKGKISESEAKTIMSKIVPSIHLIETVKLADVVIEAIPEILEMKKETFRKIDEALKSESIIATNTSQFSITELASSTTRADRFIGMHWFNPPQIMRLVELVRGLETSDSTVETILRLCRQFGKETIVCLKDTPGFLTTRILNAFLAEAYRVVEEGIATAEDVDKAAKLAFNHPMGPLELADFSGLDTALRTAMALEAVYGDRYKPTHTMRNLVQAGHLGRKTGRGWHHYA